MKVIFSLITFLLLLSACNSKNYPSHDLPDEQIIFGSGGGFTAEIKKYILLKNGQLFRSSSLTEEIEELPTADKNKSKECFSRLDSLSKMNFDHPGNRYYFLTLKTPEKENKLVWGDADHQPPTEIKDLYKTLMSLVQNQ